jgi:hypothetical protein
MFPMFAPGLFLIFLFVCSSACAQAKIDMHTLQLLGRMTVHSFMGQGGWDNSRGAFFFFEIDAVPSALLYSLWLPYVRFRCGLGVVPYLGASVFDGDNTAYVGGDWWGLLIRLKLDSASTFVLRVCS